MLHDCFTIALLWLAALTFGVARLDAAGESARSVMVGAVNTDVGLDHDVPDEATLASNETRSLPGPISLRPKGRVVVWNEAATLVTREDEARLLARGADAARADHLDPYGRVRAWMEASDGAHVLVARVPLASQRTLYPVIHGALLPLALVLFVFACVRASRSRASTAARLSASTHVDE